MKKKKKLENKKEEIVRQKEKYKLKLNLLNKDIDNFREKEKLFEEKKNLFTKREKDNIKKEEQLKEYKENLECLSIDLNKEKKNLNNIKNQIKNERKEIDEEKKIIEKEKILIKKEKEYLDKKKLRIDKKENEIKTLENRVNKEIENINNTKNKRKLEQIISDSYNNNIKTEEENISNICFLGSILKNLNEIDEHKNSNNYLNINKEFLNNKNQAILPLYLISNWLTENGCKVIVEKNAENIKINNLCLQHIFANKAIEKKYSITFDSKENNELFFNEKKRNNFINSLKTDLSKYLEINEKDIFIINPRGPKFTLDIFINDLDDFKKEKMNEYQKFRKDIFSFKNSILLEGCKLPMDLLEPKFDMKQNNWPQYLCKRGGLRYYPPYEYMGFGLKVINSYDSGDNTWIGCSNIKGEFVVAYHGIRSDDIPFTVNRIAYSYLKKGKNQNFKDDDDLNHPGQKCGIGVYVTPKIEIAERYTKEFYVDNIRKKYRIILQCRVNPYKIRMPKSNPDYWILNGNGQEIRPYRILIKESNN